MPKVTKEHVQLSNHYKAQSKPLTHKQMVKANLIQVGNLFTYYCAGSSKAYYVSSVNSDTITVKPYDCKKDLGFAETEESLLQGGLCVDVIGNSLCKDEETPIELKLRIIPYNREYGWIQKGKRGEKGYWHRGIGQNKSANDIKLRSNDLLFFYNPISNK